MTEIKYFSEGDEDDLANGLFARPYVELRDWDLADEIKHSTAFRLRDQKLKDLYPEAYAPQSTPVIEPRTTPVETKSIKRRDPVSHDIPSRVFEAIRKITSPRKMKAPAVSHIAGTKIQRARMPGVTRAEVRDGLRALLRYL